MHSHHCIYACKHINKIIATMYEAVVGWYIQEHNLKDKKIIKVAEKNGWGYTRRLLGQVQAKIFIIS